MNPRDEKDLNRLDRIRLRDYKLMAPFREKRRGRWQQSIGNVYSDGGTAYPVPVNYMRQAGDIWTENCAARVPGVLVESDLMQLEAAAADLAQALKIFLNRKIPFGQTLRRGVKDAMFGVGFFKVGMNYSETVEIGGIWHDTGQPFIDHIGLDDFCVDMTATVWEDREYCGNRYRMRKQDALHCGLFDADKVSKITPHRPTTQLEGGGQHLSSFSQGGYSDQEELEEHVWLWDWYLPKDNLVITTVDRQPGIQLRPDDRLEWQGPERGPYHILGFGDVAENILPFPPLGAIEVLHMTANLLWRKIARQAARQKSLTLVQAGNDDDAKTIGDAKDGDIVGAIDTNSGRELSTGGASQTTIQTFLASIAQLNLQGHNLNLTGGLVADSDTLGQDEILSQAGSTHMEAMRAAVTECTTGIIRDIAWYLMTDPFIKLPFTKRVAGMSTGVPTEFSAETREGDYLDYNFRISPFSMQAVTPSLLLRTYQYVMQTYVMPMMPLMEAQGMTLNLEWLLRKIGDLTNIDMDGMVRFASRANRPEQPVGQPMKQPETTRNYVRKSVPSGGGAMGNDSLMQALGGAGNGAGGQGQQGLLQAMGA